MRLTTLIVPLLSVGGLAFGGVQERLRAQLSEPLPQDDSLAVPGKNPLTFCSAPDNDILIIDSVDLEPNPPAAGKDLVISAKGTVKKAIEAGAMVHVTVKYGLITIINQNIDLCEQVTNVDLACPIEEGDMVLSKNVSLPSQIPPGKYNVFADVTSKDGDKITCLTAQVWFNTGR